jgi:diguanylate cyclase (GGDEF)-like protein
MDHIQHSRRLNLITAVLAIWLILGALAVIWIYPGAAVLGVALVIFVTVFALVDPFRFAGWLGVLLAIGAYAAALYLLVGRSTALYFPVIAASVCLLITGVLSVLAARHFRLQAQQAGNQLRMIEDLRTHDPKTGLVRLTYARQELKSEISRSQRYKLDLCLMILEVANWKQMEQELGMLKVEDLRADLANIMTGATRDVDTCFQGSRMGIILPQTNPSGASVVAERLVSGAALRLKLDLYIGIAYFPDDAVSEDDLIRSAEAALHIAVSSGRSIVFYNQIRQAVESQDGNAAVTNLRPA